MDFLLKAANNHEKISISYTTEHGKALSYGSRFFEINPKKKYIIIDQPYGEHGTYQQLVRKDKIKIFFICKGYRFLFFSQILKRDIHKQEGHSDIKVLVIRMPDKILDGERRNFFRVPAPIDPPVKLKFVSYFESNQSFENQQEMPEIEDYGMSDAIIHDISGGGLSMGSDQPLEIMVGDVVNLRFCLRPDDDVLQIEGLINNSRISTDEDSMIKGVEFVPDRSDAYKNAIKKISRYVMERQREMINPYS